MWSVVPGSQPEPEVSVHNLNHSLPPSSLLGFHLKMNETAQNKKYTSEFHSAWLDVDVFREMFRQN